MFEANESVWQDIKSKKLKMKIVINQVKTSMVMR